VDDATSGGGLVTVVTVQGDFEAQQIVGFLEAHGVAATLRGEALRRTHGLTLDGLGQVEVQVAQHQAEEAAELLEAAARGDLALADDPVDPADEQ
jgi:hypothetical protein